MDSCFAFNEAIQHDVRSNPYTVVGLYIIEPYAIALPLFFHKFGKKVPPKLSYQFFGKKQQTLKWGKRLKYSKQQTFK